MLCQQNKKNFKVGYVRMSTFNFFVNDKGEKVYYGDQVGLYRYLEEALGWKFEFVTGKPGGWGSRLPNGSYNGLVGMVERKVRYEQIICVLLSGG